MYLGPSVRRIFTCSNSDSLLYLDATQDSVPDSTPDPTAGEEGAAKDIFDEKCIYELHVARGTAASLYRRRGLACALGQKRQHMV